MEKINYNIGLIGAGRVGRALALRLNQVGYRISLIMDCYLENAKQVAKQLPNSCIISEMGNWPLLDVLLLTVPDDQIPTVAQNLCNSTVDLTNTVVAHTSGATTSQVLIPLKAKGAIVASLHPIQTFSGIEDEANKITGTYFGIEGEEKAVTILTELVQRMKGIPLVISPETKPVYHAACVFASNYVVVLMALAEELLKKLNINLQKPWKILLPLLQGVVKNMHHQDPSKALTGPILRGDVKTVQAHLQALAQESPLLVQIYRELALQALDISEQSHPELQTKYKRLKEILQTSICEKVHQ